MGDFTALTLCFLCMLQQGIAQYEPVFSSEGERTSMIYNEKREYDVVNERVICMDPLDDETGLDPDCRQGGNTHRYIRVKDVWAGRLTSNNDSYCDDPQLATTVTTRECKVVFTHRQLQEVVQECSIREICMHWLNTTLYKNLLQACGDGTGQFFLVVQYACKGMKEGELIPVHEIGTTRNVIHPHPVIYIISPNYPQFSTLPRFNCSIEIIDRTNTHSKIGADMFDYYAETFNPIHPPATCPYISALVDRPEQIDNGVCPNDVWFKHKVYSKWLGVSMSRKRTDAMGRLWVMVEALPNDYVKGGERTFSPAHLKVDCDYNGLIIPFTPAPATTTTTTTTTKPTTTLYNWGEGKERNINGGGWIEFGGDGETTPPETTTNIFDQFGQFGQNIGHDRGAIITDGEKYHANLTVIVLSIEAVLLIAILVSLAVYFNRKKLKEAKDRFMGKDPADPAAVSEAGTEETAVAAAAPAPGNKPK